MARLDAAYFYFQTHTIKKRYKNTNKTHKVLFAGLVY